MRSWNSHPNFYSVLHTKRYSKNQWNKIIENVIENTPLIFVTPIK